MNGWWNRHGASHGGPALRIAIIVALSVPRPASSQSLTPPLVPPEMHYVVDARVDLDSGRLTGGGRVTVRNVGEHRLSAVALRGLDGRSDSFEIRVGAISRRYPSAAESVVVALPTPLQPGASLEVRFRFSRPLGDLDRGFAIDRWFPQLWWGYDTHASYDVGVRAPADLLVGATGRRDAATGRYRAAHVRSFGLYLARGLEVRERTAGSTLVRSIFRPEMRECAELVLETAAQAVEFYRRRLGIYPQSSLTIIPGARRPMGGYPFAAAMVVVHGQEACAEKPRDSHWRWIAAHEVGHQYWLEHVLEKDPEQGYGWLMIGLGIWTDREFARTHGMLAVHPGLLAGYADAVRRGLNTTIEIAPEALRTLQFDYNSLVTHDKGFGVVSALAAIIGPAAFDRVVHRCLAEYAGRRLGSAEFRALAEHESGQDLGWFFVPMLRSNRFASYEVTDTVAAWERGTYTRRVTISSHGQMGLPVPVEAYFRDGTRQRHSLNRELDEQTLTFQDTAAIDSVVIDPEHEFPLVVPPPEVDSARLAEQVEALPWTGGGERSLRLYRRAVALDTRDVYVLGKLGLTLVDARRYEDALAAFDRIVQVNPDTASIWRFGALAWRGLLNDLLGRRAAAVESYRQALAVPGTPTLQHSQFGLTLDRDFIEQRLRTPFVWH